MTWSQLRAPVLIAALALLWGSGFFWIKLSLVGLSPFQLTFARLALGALVLGCLVAGRRLRVPREPRMWGHLAIAALISNAVPYTLFALAEQTVPSSLAGTINATTPLWTAVLAYTVGVDRLRCRRRVLGLIVGFAGAVILLAPWNIAASESLLGVLACLGAAVSYGLSYVYQARYITNRGYSPPVLAFGQLCAATVLLALTLPVTSDRPLRLEGSVLLAILVLGVLGTGAAYVINYALITTEGPTTASVVTYLVPVVAVTLGLLVLREAIGLHIFLGTALILSGVALVQRRHGSVPKTSRASRTQNTSNRQK